MFDEQIKKKNQMEAELFTESYQKLAEVVTGETAHRTSAAAFC